MNSTRFGALNRLVLDYKESEWPRDSLGEFDVIVGPISVPREISVRSHKDRNPGIGGSEFYSIQLALLLRDAGFKVALEFFGTAPKLERIFEVQSDVFLDETARVRVTNSAMAFSISNALPEKQDMILVSHHPHDRWLNSILNAKTRVLAVVNVGRYQYFSNRTRRASHVWLPAFTPVPPLDRGNNSGQLRYRAGHISSFHPSKGFHIIVKGWMKYVEHLERPSHPKIQVIGSDSLYSGGHGKSHQIPISGAYGNRITKILSNSRSNWRYHVVFEGLIPGSPIGEIENWEVAIFNPLGLSEADPIVVQDAFSVSTPVIAGTLFGLYDYMRYFPELSAHTSFGISRRLRQLDRDSTLRRSVRAKVDALYLELLDRRNRTEELWAENISSVIKGQPIMGLDTGIKEPALWFRLQLGVLLLALQSVGGRLLGFLRKIRGL